MYIYIYSIHIYVYCADSMYIYGKRSSISLDGKR